jgi:DNA repair exonuclease SbcCD ATPase subunit
MSKGKEALASRNAEIKNLLARIKDMDLEIKRLVQIEKILLKENNQLKSYKDRMKIVANATATADELRADVDYLVAQVALWKSRAIILAEADRDNDESMFSKESLAVLADMNMLPACMSYSRYAKRAIRSGSKVKKQWDMINEARKEVEANGIKGVLKNV